MIKSGNALHKKSAISLEETWLSVLKWELSGSEWESFLSQFPEGSWSPDKIVSDKMSSDRTTSLIERWFVSSSLVGLKSFLEEVKSAYPNLNGRVVTRAIINGLSRKEQKLWDQKKWMESGEEVIVIDWFNSYKKNIASDAHCLQALLNSAVESNALEFAKILINDGANPQEAICFSTSDVAAKLMLGCCKRVNPMEMVSDARRFVMDAQFSSEQKSIWERLQKKAYNTSKDRGQVMKCVYQHVQKNDVEVAKEMLLSVVESQKDENIINMINLSSKDVWTWDFGQGRTLLMLLADNGNLDIVDSTRIANRPIDKSACFRQRCDKGWSALMYRLNCGFSGLMNVGIGGTIENNSFKDVGLTSKEVAIVLYESLLKEHVPTMQFFTFKNRKDKALGISLDEVVSELTLISEQDGDKIPLKLLDALSRGELDVGSADILMKEIGKRTKDNLLLKNAPSWSSLECILKLLDIWDGSISGVLSDDDVAKAAEKEIKRCIGRGSDPYKFLHDIIDIHENDGSEIIFKIAEKLSLMRVNNIAQGRPAKAKNAL